MDRLTIQHLKSSVTDFLRSVSNTPIAELYGVTDGKAVGTYVERQFTQYLKQKFIFEEGNAAKGIDFPDIAVDLKVTSSRQPQSSSPFRSASQKVYGLGYHLLVFVYNKVDDDAQSVTKLIFENAIFVHRDHTADFQTTRGILDILSRDGNLDDIDAFLEDRNLPVDEMGRRQLAERILQNPPQQGYITVSNALQWRLQYGRAIRLASEGGSEGLTNLL
ncbi:MAG: restriction endonuclease [Anaerolineae bacterium]|nr:restriction endonuclease [Anaerolineae bacterium]